MSTEEHEALLFLLAATNPLRRSNGRRRRVTWDCDEEDLSKWQGVNVNREGRVVSLLLPNADLEGRIPAQLGSLSKLKYLNLKNNHLSGRIPGSLGALSELQNLDLEGNSLDGPIPEELLKHPRLSQFKTGLAVDKPTGLDLDEINVPDVISRRHAMKSLIVPVLLGYADFFSDLQTAASYYKAGHMMWCVLVLVFALGPTLVLSIFYLSSIGWERRVLVAMQLSLLVEAGITVKDESYSPVVALLRVVEPLLESVPQLLLQLYVMLRVCNADELLPSTTLVFRVASVCLSAVSLAYAATDLSSVDRLIEFGSDFPTGGWTWCWFGGITGLVFSRVPAHGESPMNNGCGFVHIRTHVWLCFVYHVLEIVCRFVPLVMLLLVIRGWFFLVLVYLWGSRSLIVLTADSTTLKFNFWVRMVAMPFLDSIMDGTKEFGVGLVLTFLEFVVCIAIYNFFGHDNLPFPVQQRLAQVTIFSMVGKLVLALVVILPFKIPTW